MDTEGFEVQHEQAFGSENPHIRVHRNTECMDYSTHWHTPLEILMPVENSYTASVGNRVYELQPGDILIVSPNVYHAYKAPDTGVRYFILIDVGALKDILGISQILSVLNPAALFTPSGDAAVHAKLKQLVMDICDLFFSRDDFSPVLEKEKASGQPQKLNLTEPLIYSKMIELLTTAAQSRAGARPEFRFAPSKRQEYINKFTMICSYIDEHCTGSLSLEEAAKLLNFSKYHFARLFKEFTQESFYRYVNRKRIQYAEQLLIHETMSITEIAYSSGYSNTSSFIRMFKSINGCTPRAFREQSRKKQTP